MFDRLLAVRRATPAMLRETVDALPLRVRIAMYDGVREDHIIVGAYTDDRSGMCPMLSAHRRGGRCSFPLFARVWDAYAGAPRRGYRTADPAHVEQLADALRASIEYDLRTPIASSPETTIRSRAANVGTSRSPSRGRDAPPSQQDGRLRPALRSR